MKQKDLVRRLQASARRKQRAAALEQQSPNQIAKDIREKSDGFLLSPEWKALRKEAIARYGSVCCKCGREPSRDSPVNIDHIKCRKFFPWLALEITNLQPLCGSCNKLKGNGPPVDYRRHAVRSMGVSSP